MGERRLGMATTDYADYVTFEGVTSASAVSWNTIDSSGNWMYVSPAVGEALYPESAVFKGFYSPKQDNIWQGKDPMGKNK